MAIIAQDMRTTARPGAFGARPDSFRADSYRADERGAAAPISLTLGAAAAGGAILGILMALLAAWLI